MWEGGGGLCLISYFFVCILAQNEYYDGYMVSVAYWGALNGKLITHLVDFDL